MTKAQSLTQFTVKGHSTFPLDMLRYDQCWPADTASALEITNLIETHGVHERARTITLHTWNVGITPDRWKIFGWTVISQDRV